MKKIMILTVVTMIVSSIGCCQARPRMSWFRGDACNECAANDATPNYGEYSSGVVNGYNNGVVNGYNNGGVNGYNNGVVIPNLPALPGPAAPNE